MSVHVFYGCAKRRMPNRPRCLFCDKRRTWVAITYFGAPVCRECWETKWRTSEDGECDPPFDEITRETTGEWLSARSAAGDEARTAWCEAALASARGETGQ